MHTHSQHRMLLLDSYMMYYHALKPDAWKNVHTLLQWHSQVTGDDARTQHGHTVFLKTVGYWVERRSI